MFVKKLFVFADLQLTLTPLCYCNCSCHNTAYPSESLRAAVGRRSATCTMHKTAVQRQPPTKDFSALTTDTKQKTYIQCKLNWLAVMCCVFRRQLHSFRYNPFSLSKQGALGPQGVQFQFNSHSFTIHDSQIRNTAFQCQNEMLVPVP